METKKINYSNNEMDSKSFALKVAKIASDKKGENISILDLHDVSSLTDYLVIINGLNEKHIKALSDEIGVKVKQDLGVFSLHVDGGSNCKWIVMDYIDVIVHLFLPEERDHYGLEKLWADAKAISYVE